MQSETIARILTETQVKERVLYSSSQLRRMEQAGKFPRRLKLGPNRVGWLASEIEKWIETCAAARVDQ